MAIFGDRPLGGGVALRAVVSEQTAMPVFRRVAGRAVEQRLLALELRRVRRLGTLFEPCDERIARLIGRGRSLLDLLQADTREGRVIHLCRARDSPLMFEMAGSAGTDVGVKGARLALEDGCVVGVADDAVLCLDTLHWRVARGAVVFEKGVRLRQLAGRYHVLPGGGREDRARRLSLMTGGERKESEREQRESQSREEDKFGQFHDDHLSPK